MKGEYRSHQPPQHPTGGWIDYLGAGPPDPGDSSSGEGVGWRSGKSGQDQFADAGGIGLAPHFLHHRANQGADRS